MKTRVTNLNQTNESFQRDAFATINKDLRMSNTILSLSRFTLFLSVLLLSAVIALPFMANVSFGVFVTLLTAVAVVGVISFVLIRNTKKELKEISLKLKIANDMNELRYNCREIYGSLYRFSTTPIKVGVINFYPIKIQLPSGERITAYAEDYILDAAKRKESGAYFHLTRNNVLRSVSGFSEIY